MSFEDPFEDFKRKQAAQPKPAGGDPAPSQRDRLEKISDYFPAVKPGAPSPAGAAPSSSSPIPNLSIVALCNILRAKGILTPDDVRRVLDGKA
jgi:hypothetical protein